MDNNKTITPPSPQEHQRQQKLAWRQHIKQTQRWLTKSGNLFLHNSITHTKEECTDIAKSDTNNERHVPTDSAHAQCSQPTIRLAQRGCNAAYHLYSVINWTIKKLNRNKHVSFAKQNKVYLFDATTTPSIILT